MEKAIGFGTVFSSYIVYGIFGRSGSRMWREMDREWEVIENTYWVDFFRIKYFFHPKDFERQFDGYGGSEIVPCYDITRNLSTVNFKWQRKRKITHLFKEIQDLGLKRGVWIEQTLIERWIFFRCLNVLIPMQQSTVENFRAFQWEKVPCFRDESWGSSVSYVQVFADAFLERTPEVVWVTQCPSFERTLRIPTIVDFGNEGISLRTCLCFWNIWAN